MTDIERIREYVKTLPSTQMSYNGNDVLAYEYTEYFDGSVGFWYVTPEGRIASVRTRQ